VPLQYGSRLVKRIDQGWREKFGGQGICNTLEKSSTLRQWLQDNDLKVYLSTFILWVMILFIFIFICSNSL
jgi:NADH-ubiquinone oxidoreductase chain 5